MHAHLIDHYQPMQSPLHRMDGRIKVTFTLAFILTCTFLPTGAWAAYILLSSLLICLLLIANLSISYALKRSLLVLPFILAAVPLVFRSSEHLLVTVPLGWFEIDISKDGLIRFLSIGIKSWISVLAATLLASTTSFLHILSSMRAMKLPRILVAIISLMWRYLSLMVDEMDRLTRARSSRNSHNRHTGERPGGTLYWRAKVTGGMAGSLFIRSLERSERVYQAMLSRGYDGEIRADDTPLLDAQSFFILALALIALVLVAVLSYWSQGAM